MIPEAARKYVYYEEPGIVLLHGDCLEILKHLYGQSIDCLVTSPPYGIEKEYEKNETIEDLIRKIESIYLLGLDFLKHDGSLTFNFQDIFVKRHCMSRHYSEFGEKYGYEFAGNRIWKKDPAWMNSPWISNSNYPVLEWEYIWTFTLGQRKLNKESRKLANRGIWEFQSVKENKQHPAMFPIDIPSSILKVYSSLQDLILDPFLGSGTTAVACKQLGRKCIGIEIESKYLDIAIERLKQEVLF